MLENKKLNLNDLVFVKIGPNHRHLFKKFETYQKDLKDFLVEEALHSQDISISNTFLVFERNNYNLNDNKNSDDLTLLGYITVLCDSIRLDGDLKNLFKQKDVNYKSLPALKIGRLCIDDRFRGRGIGKLAMLWAINLVCDLNRKLACRFITVDAMKHPEQDKDSYFFYKKLGFKILKKRDNQNEREIAMNKTGTVSLYLDLYQIIREVKF